MPDVLVLSDEVDGPVDAVVGAMRRRGADVRVFGTRSLPSPSHGISLELGSDGVPRALQLTSNADSIDLLEVKSVWWRRPHRPRSDHRDEAIRAFIEDEYSLALSGLANINTQTRWVNRPWVERRLERNKLAQLYLAQAAGLEVPETICSSVPDDVLAFAERHGTVAVKSAAGWCARTENGYRMAYTQRMSAAELAADTAAIQRAPVIVQPYLDKAYELRVTVAGSAIFTCKIDSQASLRTEVDWRRYDFAHVAHDAVQLDAGTATRIRDFMRAAGLDFAAIDLVVRPDGSIVFLEANPSGQFLWLEALTNARIVESMADLLLDRANPPPETVEQAPDTTERSGTCADVV